MTQSRFRLAIGDKQWSSWSLRPWLAMRRQGLAFDEVPVRLRRPDTAAEIGKLSASGKVPALIDGDLVIWDSLAILEYLAEEHPTLWPADRKARALARAVNAEMHSSFQPLRNHCPMDILLRQPMATLPDEVAANVRRVVAIWRDCRARHGQGGPFLFGAFSAADAMYAPVASRFRTYIPDLGVYGDDGTAAALVETIFAMPEMTTWIDGAKAEAKRVS